MIKNQQKTIILLVAMILIVATLSALMLSKDSNKNPLGIFVAYIDPATGSYYTIRGSRMWLNDEIYLQYTGTKQTLSYVTVDNYNLKKEVESPVQIKTTYTLVGSHPKDPNAVRSYMLEKGEYYVTTSYGEVNPKLYTIHWFPITVYIQ